MHLERSIPNHFKYVIHQLPKQNPMAWLSVVCLIIGVKHIKFIRVSRRVIFIRVLHELQNPEVWSDRMECGQLSSVWLRLPVTIDWCEAVLYSR
jgi:hypothetical protein